MEGRRKTRVMRVAIDTGGTFTDCVWVADGRIRILKVFSTPDDPSRAILEALNKIGIEDGILLLHGTTVGTNTLLQRKGGHVALVTTVGFEDVIEIGRQARPKLYDFFFDRVEPLVSREMRFGVEERTASDGEILQIAAEAELQSLAERIRSAKPDAVAVSLLFSFINPANEKAIAQALRPLGVPLSVSHEILPEFREYERTSTVVMNAYLQPVMQKYLESLARRIQSGNPRSRIFIMQSSGGITALETAAREPVRTVLSGPAGGVVGAAAMAQRSGYERIISFDMGGTSTDVALIDSEAQPSSQSEIAGLPIGVPMLDIHTVGAGGGSVARFDAARALRVGPESAGADPGPICYGRGTEPTVTDANLILGRLRPERFLGGNFTPDLERTRHLLAEWLKKSQSRLGMKQFAEGVIRVVNATMEKAIRVVSIERGYDPREFALVAFGGAGGLHACDLAEALSIPYVIIPTLPGALSAYGILVSDVVKDYSRTVLLRVADALPTEIIEKHFSTLRDRAEKDFRKENWQGKITHNLSVDVRYRGQGYELNVPYTRNLQAAFASEHQRRYGYKYENREIELVTLRLRSRMKSTQNRSASSLREPHIGETGKVEVRSAPVVIDGRVSQAAIYERESLVAGKKLSGPAIVTEYSATTMIPRSKRFWLDSQGNLLVQISAEGRRERRA